MPERLPTVKPTVMVGSILTSGDVNTGQLMQSFGGSKTVTRLSGVVGPDINLWVGGGRLDTVQIHPGVGTTMPAASGIPLFFYDSAVAVSGGPLATSGHKVLAKIWPSEPETLVNATYNSGLLSTGRGPINVGVVFTSGLVFTTASGMMGWTATFTPAVSGATGTTP